ncbi:MAG: beta-propeller domain-containing protein [Acutalibacteraceae bacterium]
MLNDNDFLQSISAKAENSQIPESISPETVQGKLTGVKRKRNFVPYVSVLLAVLIFATGIGVYRFAGKSGNGDITYSPSGKAPMVNISKTENYSNIYDKLLSMKSDSEYNDYFNGFISPDGLSDDLSIKGESNGTFSPSANENISQGSNNAYENEDFSDTNNQVEGAQESDIVKTDGKYIYYIDRDEDVIYAVEASNGQTKLLSSMKLNDMFLKSVIEEAKETPLATATDATPTNPIDNSHETLNDLHTDGFISNIIAGDYDYYDDNEQEDDFKYNINYIELFLNGDEVVVIAEKYHNNRFYGFYNKTNQNDCYMPIHVYATKNETIAIFYDYSDRQTPVFKNSIGISGSYISSRMIDNMLYIVTTEGIYRGNINEKIPESFVPTLREGDSYVTESSDDIYMLDDFTNAQYLNVCGINVDDFGKIVDSKSILGSGEDIYSSTKNLYVYDTVYNFDWNRNYSEELTDGFYDYNQTQLTKFELNDGQISLKASNLINGHLINQFAIDEYKDFVRLAITHDGDRVENGESDSWEHWNTLSIFDSNLNLVSSIDHLALGESIKSVRFDGEIGYFVTFKNTDPLFTVDLKNPKEPKILSELKIPGFSEYLHVYSDDLLFGFGEDADEEDGETTGIKMSMFDVSDKADVKQIANYIIGNYKYGTDENNKYSYNFYESPALENHKAILVAPEKQLIGIPLAQIYGNYDDEVSEDGFEGGEKLFYAFYTYDRDNGFTQLGEAVISDFVFNSFDDIYNDDYIDPYSDSLRGLYIGDYLYVVSQVGCMSFTLSDFSKVSEISF